MHLTSDANSDAALAELSAHLGERLVTSGSVLDQHSRDESHHLPVAPRAVALCGCLEDVLVVLRVCREHTLPVVPFGAGTGLEGGAIPVAGGISVDLSHMNRILRMSPEDLDVSVEAGVTLSVLNRRLRDDGMFFPVDPGSDPTMGGMVATRASGTNAVRYGTMRENTLGLTVALSTGEVITTGGRVRKSAAGYDLTRLFVGSEGTLGVITEVTLRIHGLPETVTAGVCSFPGLHAAVAAVITTMQLGIPVARIELLDEVMMRAVNAHSAFDHPSSPTLLLEFHGAPAAVAEQAHEVEGIVTEYGGRVSWAATPADRERLWTARHRALYAAKALRPGAQTWSTDVCVPISRLGDCIEATKADIEASHLLAPIVGHVGDGNFHLSFVLDAADPTEMAAAAAVDERMVERALAMEGTCTGEHGIGLGKIGYLERERGPGIAVMRRLKEAIDPLGIMNPGKVLRQAHPASRP
jgi:D-lactate dehydrogenase (cytochrome)